MTRPSQCSNCRGNRRKDFEQQVEMRNFDDETVRILLNHRVDLLLKVQCRFEINPSAHAEDPAAAFSLKFCDHCSSARSSFATSNSSRARSTRTAFHPSSGAPNKPRGLLAAARTTCFLAFGVSYESAG